MYFKDNLKYLRGKENISLRKLAEKTGVNNVTLFQIESGERRNPTINNISKIAKYFEISIDDFVYKKLGK